MSFKSSEKIGDCIGCLFIGVITSWYRIPHESYSTSSTTYPLVSILRLLSSFRWYIRESFLQCEACRPVCGMTFRLVAYSPLQFSASSKGASTRQAMYTSRKRRGVLSIAAFNAISGIACRIGALVFPTLPLASFQTNLLLFLRAPSLLISGYLSIAQ